MPREVGKFTEQDWVRHGITGSYLCSQVQPMLGVTIESKDYTKFWQAHTGLSMATEFQPCRDKYYLVIHPGNTEYMRCPKCGCVYRLEWGSP